MGLKSCIQTVLAYILLKTCRTCIVSDLSLLVIHVSIHSHVSNSTSHMRASCPFVAAHIFCAYISKQDDVTSVCTVLRPVYMIAVTEVRRETGYFLNHHTLNCTEKDSSMLRALFCL